MKKQKIFFKIFKPKSLPNNPTTQQKQFLTMIINNNILKINNIYISRICWNIVFFVGYLRVLLGKDFFSVYFDFFYFFFVGQTFSSTQQTKRKNIVDYQIFIYFVGLLGCWAQKKRFTKTKKK
ncbi:MAG: hypothetical protein LBP63_11075 [Prevotellaceae bacterium]|jgi:hypothetical protein|nr:hypothetical protein [Prevotellaceae bacterium]